MDKPDESLHRLFSTVIKLHYSRAHERLSRLGLHRGQISVLFCLHEKDGLTQRELAEKVYITPATVNTILKRMEKTGLIQRRDDPSDMRISRVWLTPVGEEMHLKAKAHLAVLEEQCFSTFSPEERILLRRFFLEMKANLTR